MTFDKANPPRKFGWATTWEQCIEKGEPIGPAGISYEETAEGTQYLDYRDSSGQLVGMLRLSGPHSYWSGQALIIVDPNHRRRGIATALFAAAAERGFDIDLQRQTYTREGWALMTRIVQMPYWKERYETRLARLVARSTIRRKFLGAQQTLFP